MKMNKLVFNKILIKISIATLLFMPFLLSFTNQAQAIETGTIKIVLSSPIEWIPITITKIGTSTINTDGTATYELLDTLKSTNIKFNNLDDENIANHLAYYMKDKKLDSKTVLTNKEGVAVFENLDIGVYLVQQRESNTQCAFAPYLLSVPSHINNQWLYTITSTPKTITPDTSQDNLTIIAHKMWRGYANHPSKVEVLLLKNNDVYDKQILSADNDWMYTWKDLPNNVLWSLVENNIPSGYQVAYKVENNETTIINSLITPNNNPQTNGGSGNNGTISPTFNPTTTTTQSIEPLIQTGHIVIRILIFFVLGVGLILIGFYLRRSESNHEKNK